MSTSLAGRVLLSVSAIFTTVGTYAFDWNATHIYNPSWPPHAKFHNGQTMAMAVLLPAASLFFVWRKKGDAQTNVLAGAVFAAMYWLTQALAYLYPGVAWTDPQFLEAGQSLSDHGPQLILDSVFGSLIAIGYFLLRRGTSRGDA